MSGSMCFHPDGDPRMIAQSPDCCVISYDSRLPAAVSLSVFLYTKAQARALAAAAAAAEALLPDTVSYHGLAELMPRTLEEIEQIGRGGTA